MKNKAFWRMISDMPPIDWALLAAEQRGYRHTPATIKRFTATKKRNLAIKRKARAKEKPPRPPVRQRLRINSVEVLLGSMETGAWYGRTDIQHLSGLKRGTVATAILRAESLGLLMRTRNPAWERQGGAECEFLYRKTSDAGSTTEQTSECARNELEREN
ncbi:hypothetical protein AB8A28_19945 [Tardiphaga sp. 71_E8_N1_1]|uniref:hypothetical protein n=1 Tax=Tardiphaga sp. 71_E8_N1_1 TaxID=3240784 RepID=UPI003F8C7C36